MNSGLEIHFTLLGFEFRLQIRRPRSARIAIQKYEVVSAPLQPEIRRTLLRRLKSSVRAGLPMVEPDSNSSLSRPQCVRHSRLGLDGRRGSLRGL